MFCLLAWESLALIAWGHIRHMDGFTPGQFTWFTPGQTDSFDHQAGQGVNSYKLGKFKV
jgi:hypothetical protein